MASYRKVKNCGPVPHPDRSGKFLYDGEVVEGDDWAPFVALGYIELVEDVPVVEVAPVAEVPVVTEVVPKSDVETPVETIAPVESDEAQKTVSEVPEVVAEAPAELPDAE